MNDHINEFQPRIDIPWLVVMAINVYRLAGCNVKIDPTTNGGAQITAIKNEKLVYHISLRGKSPKRKP